MKNIKKFNSFVNENRIYPIGYDESENIFNRRSRRKEREEVEKNNIRKEEELKKLDIKNKKMKENLPPNIDQLINDIINGDIKIVNSLDTGGPFGDMYIFYLDNDMQIKINIFSYDQHPDWAVDIHNCYFYIKHDKNNIDKYEITYETFNELKSKVKEYLKNKYGYKSDDDDEGYGW
jgi:hypothetical protein